MHSLAERLGGRHAAIGLVTIVVLGGIVIANFSGVGRSLLAGDGARSVMVTFADAQQLRAGNPVRIDGVEIGKVKEISATDDGRMSQIELRLNDDAGPLYADASATMRWRTVLGAAFYITLRRGNPATGELRAGIPASRTTNQVELEDVTSVVRGDARTGLQTLPGELADALADPEPLGDALETAARVSPSVEKGVGALRGVREDADLRRLVSATANTVDVLGRSPGELRGVVAGAAATLDTTGVHAEAIRRTLTEAPGVMQRTNLTLGRLDGTLALADPVVDALKAPAAKLGPVLAELNPTVRGADRLLLRAVPLLRSLRPTVRSLAATARRGLPLLTEVQPSLDRVQRTILPYLAEKDPGTGKSTTVMIGGTFAGLGAGSAGAEDKHGHFLRFALTAGSAPLYLPCQIYANNPDKAKAVECESLQQTVNSLVQYNPIGQPAGTSAGPAAPRSKR